MTCRSCSPDRPRSGIPSLVPVEGHRFRGRPKLHPAADPGAGGVVVLPAAGRGDPAQLGMDRRAVIALVVVLGENLPVGGGIVFVPAGDHEPAHLVRRQHGIQRPKCVVERCGHASAVHEDQAVPLGARQLDQAPLTRVEARLVLEARSRAQAPVKAVRPRVIRAYDRLPRHRGRPAGEELMPAVPAVVRERSDGAVRAAHEEHAAVPAVLGALIARAGQLVAARRADPAAPEEVLLLPVEYGLAGVGAGRQHGALPERGQHPRERRRVERGRGSRVAEGEAGGSGGRSEGA